MFDNYNTKIKYISKQGKKDMFGYTDGNEQEQFVRYIGGIDIQINENNTFRIEHRLLYQCPFNVSEGDKFKIDGTEMVVKKSEAVPDVYDNIIYWSVQVV